MVKVAACALVSAWVALAPCVAAAGLGAMASSQAMQLVQGCLQPPSEAEADALAKSVGAYAFSDDRLKREQARNDTSMAPDPTRPGQAFRTKTLVTTFLGWDLPGAGGMLTYDEEEQRQDRIDQSTGQSLSPQRVSRNRTCRVQTPVQNGREIFQAYEALQSEGYGLLLTPDRLSLVVFTFDQNRFDIELQIELDKPLPGVEPAPREAGASRVILSDAGPGFLGTVNPGVPTVKLTRAALLAAIDQPATIDFGHMAIEPVTERVSMLP